MEASPHEPVQATGGRLKHKQILLLAVYAHPGKTAGELAPIAKLDRVEVGRRLPDLRADGLVSNGQSRRCKELGSRQQTWYPATEPEERQTELF